MKGTIRREEARHGCRYSGVKDENVHFLDLPFYETGLVKKNDLGEADVAIVKKLLQDIKPDQMFVAGDPVSYTHLGRVVSRTQTIPIVRNALLRIRRK